MYYFRKAIIPVLLSTFWISISEFLRNSFFLHSYWTDHYNSLGIIFPEKPLNGAVWGIWSLCFAIAVYIISRRFSLFQTTFLSWFVGFVMMWLVTGNMGVLPYKILFFAIPLSIFESFIATYIIVKLSSKKDL